MNDIKMMDFGHSYFGVQSESVKHNNVEIGNMSKEYTSNFCLPLKILDMIKPVPLFPNGKDDNYIEIVDNPYQGNKIRIIDKWSRVKIATYISIEVEGSP